MASMDIFELDPQFRQVHEQWQSVTLGDINSQMAELRPAYVDIGRNETVGVVSLVPDAKDYDETSHVALMLPHQQSWKPSMFIRAKIMQQTVAPNSTIHVFPNNSVGKRYYQFPAEMISRVTQGLLAADAGIVLLGNMQAAALEKLVGRNPSDLKLTGYSMGGLAALSVASMSNHDLPISHVNADEVPSAENRDVLSLRKDFFHSSSWGRQRAAVRDSGLPALSKALNRPRMAGDLAKFALALGIQENQVLEQSMTGSADALIAKVEANPSIKIKLGYVAGSKIFQPQSTYSSRSVRQQYGTDDDYRHAFADNVFAHALMVRDGFSL